MQDVLLRNTTIEIGNPVYQVNLNPTLNTEFGFTYNKANSLKEKNANRTTIMRKEDVVNKLAFMWLRKNEEFSDEAIQLISYYHKRKMKVVKYVSGDQDMETGIENLLTDLVKDLS